MDLAELSARFIGGKTPKKESTPKKETKTPYRGKPLTTDPDVLSRVVLKMIDEKKITPEFQTLISDKIQSERAEIREKINFTLNPFKSGKKKSKITDIAGPLDVGHAILKLAANNDLPQDAELQIIAQIDEYRDETAKKTKEAINAGKILSAKQREILLDKLKKRFEEHDKDPQFKKSRNGAKWNDVEDSIGLFPEKLWSLNKMENTGGEPDVVSYDNKTGEYIFMDCSDEIPKGRKNLAYDREAEDLVKTERAEMGCWGNAVDKAAAMGIELLSVEQFKKFSKLIKSPKNQFTWLKTDEITRKKYGEALVGYFSDYYSGSYRWEGSDPAGDNKFPLDYGGLRGILRV